MSDVLKLLVAMKIFEANCMLPNSEIFETDKWICLRNVERFKSHVSIA